MGQLPGRGVVEVKPIAEDAWLTADSSQVSGYWTRYRLVLVTNSRDFVLLGEDTVGRPTKLETFRLARNAEEFHTKLETPRTFAREVGVGLGEYLCRALSHSATLVEPGDLAWLLASYARDGLARIESAGDTSALGPYRSALEEALGVRFEGDRGEEFFRSTLVQTLFYGIFSAWVLWAHQIPRPAGPFNWHEAVWHLRVPVIQALYQQVSIPAHLRQMDLVEVLNWAAAALDRVDRSAFFDRFNEGEAVPYFYEPFLQAFDPKLRKQLGVWYTPTEVVRYMVARVDRALKDDLGIADGLAASNVYVLDPCCGTGAFLAEVLRRIAANLTGRGLGALVGARVRQAAMTRVFGFEIMPAPLVVAHLQLGLTLQDLDAALAEDGTERASVFLTNALTGWEQTEHRPRTLPFPGLDEERDRAERVKREEPVLVILGNPPYNGFAGVAVGDEERSLSSAYRQTRRVQQSEGQGLNDLYVRFFRIAERRIAEQTGQGIVCYISNYSWLDGLSFTGMRERYLEAFDIIRIDCLNGDKYRTGKRTPEGGPDPSIFSTPDNPIGIQVGTAITTLIRKADHTPTRSMSFRDLWGRAKHEELKETADTDSGELYDDFLPILELGLPFRPLAVRDDWDDWPALPDLLPVSFSGVNTARDGFLVDIDLDRLTGRVTEYFNADLSHGEIARRHPIAMREIRRFDPNSARDVLLRRGGPVDSGFVRYAYRPFDDRWLYWEADTKLLDRKRAEYKPHVFDGNQWFSSSHRIRKGETEPQTAFTRHMASYHLLERVSNWFPAWLREDGLDIDGYGNRRPNLSAAASTYLNRLGMGVDDLFHHVLAVLHNPAYREANAGGLRMGWPRIPLPGWPDGLGSGARDELASSAEHGRDLATLLDSETPVPGVTTGTLRSEIASVAVPSTTDNGGNMAGNDFALTVGWGHFGQANAVMPGGGRAEERPYSTHERDLLSEATRALGDTTFDIYLNDRAYWRNVPASVWDYKLGGYQVLKKWLSYREQRVIGRAMLPEEVQHFMNTARRIAAILLCTSR